MEHPTTVEDDVPAGPAIPGLSWRHFRGEADYPGLLAVNTACKLADGQDYDLHTLDTLRAVYAANSRHDPARDTLIAEAGGQMVAYGRLYLERELDGTRAYWHVGFVVPAWRGRGVGRALLAWSEAHARVLAAREPPGSPACLSTVVRAGTTGLDGLVQAHGFAPVRYDYHMETPDLDHIPAAPLPAGIAIRPAQPEHYRAIWEANTEAFRDHWGAGETDETDFANWLHEPQFQPDLWVVAWAGDAVAGSILNYIDAAYNARSGRRIGYTEYISVRRPWRRQGLARAMLARSMALHKAQGMTQTALGVDAQNPSGALRLYESMGYQVVAQETTYRKAL